MKASSCAVKAGLLKELTEAGGDFGFDDGLEIDMKGLGGQHVFGVAWDS